MSADRRMLCAALVFMTVAAALPRAVSSQNRWEREVHDQLHRALNAVKANAGGAAVVTKTGVLNEEDIEAFSVSLDRGVTYSILGVCDHDCSRLTLVLATLANSELALDRNSENLPILQFTPTATTQYRVRVVMEGCRMNPCWYGVGIIPSGQQKPNSP